MLEKGSEVGAHILSGAVLDPKALNELIPDWKDKGSPLTVPVTENHHWVLTKNGKWAMPGLMLPPFMHNKGTYTLSLGNFCRWLAGQAEELGVEIFPGFPAAEILYHDDGAVKGVATGDMGIARDGTHRADYQPGMELHARYTFFAEGARGHLTKRLTEIFDLRKDSGPQVFGLGVKELWDVPAGKTQARASDPQPGLAARGGVGRRVPLPPGKRPGRLGVRRRARLRQPVFVAVRGIPALEDPSCDPCRDRGRQARVLRRPGDQRGRLAGDSRTSRGTYDLGCFLEQKDVQFVAVCDVKEARRIAVKKMADEKYGNQNCHMYRDFRELLDRSDIDAVLIATGPNWHARWPCTPPRPARTCTAKSPARRTSRRA